MVGQYAGRPVEQTAQALNNVLINIVASVNSTITESRSANRLLIV